MDATDAERLDQAIRWQALVTPDAIALVQNQRKLNYQATVQAIDRNARALLAAGVSRGDRVAVFGFSSIDAVLALLGITSVGAAYVGLSPKYRHRELVHILRDCDPRLVFNLAPREDAAQANDAANETGHTVIVRASSDRGVTLQEFIARGDAFATEALEQSRREVDPAAPAVVLYTSGSTGAPKGAMISHHALIRGREILAQLVPVRPRCMTDYPINHISWVLETCLLTLDLAGTLYLRERFDPTATLRMIEAERLNVWQGAPSMYFMCLQDAEFDGHDLSSIESLLFFGGPLPVDALRILHDRTGARLATGWGMTETTGGCTLTDADADLETLATTVGRCDPRIELRIINERGAEVARGDAGEILVRGETLFLGYLNQPEATAETIDRDGFLHTGDIARDRGDGNIELVGRKKEMFKSGGYNVYPTEVELVLGEHPEVAVAAVVPIPDRLWGEVGVAFVGPRSPASPPSEEQLKAFCRERLANYKVPKHFSIRHDLPILPSGKVDKRTLRETTSLPVDELPATERSSSAT